MTTFYERAQATITRLFNESNQKAQAATLIQRVGGGSPSNASYQSAADVSTPIRLVLFPKIETGRDNHAADIGQWWVVIDASELTVTIKANDIISCSEGELTVVMPGLIAPGGVNLIYDSICRK